MKKGMPIKIIMIPLLIGNIAAYALISTNCDLQNKPTVKINLPNISAENYNGKIQTMIFLNNLK